ncbi:hypothetical protein N9891_00090 [bacterium]|nr:hypothetical protein [bacterium]
MTSHVGIYRDAPIVKILHHKWQDLLILDSPESVEWRFDGIHGSELDNPPSRGIPLQVNATGDPELGTRIIAHYEVHGIEGGLPSHARCDIFVIHPKKDFESEKRVMVYYNKDAIIYPLSGHVEGGSSFHSETGESLEQLKTEGSKAFFELLNLVKEHGQAYPNVTGLPKSRFER